MKKIFVLVCAVWMTLSFAAVSSAESDWTGNLNFFLGGKSLDKDDWEPLEEHGEIGAELDFKKKGWPVSIAVESMGSTKEKTILGTDAELMTHEFNIGIKKVFSLPKYNKFHPFLGGGISFISAKTNPEVFGLTPGGAGVTYWMEADGVGYWVAGGIYYTLGEHFNLGLETKVSSAKAKFTGISGKKDLGGSHFGLILGYHW